MTKEDSVSRWEQLYTIPTVMDLQLRANLVHDHQGQKFLDRTYTEWLEKASRLRANDMIKNLDA